MLKFIDEVEIETKKILMRVDFNVSLNPDHSIANDERIRQTIPTIKHLLQGDNTIIIMSHLGQPKGYDESVSLANVAHRLEELIKEHVAFVPFATGLTIPPTSARIIVLDNIRFHKGEKGNDPAFAASLAALADVYVNDAFGVCHRPDTSVVGLSPLLPHYAGLLLKKEISMIAKVMDTPTKPVVAILGGAKISTKINLISKLMDVADYLIIGGGLANTFIRAENHSIGKSIFEYEEVETARRIMFEAQRKNTHILLPSDAVVGKTVESIDSVVKKVTDIADIELILDIGPETQAVFGAAIAKAKTIIWNGPMGYTENPEYKRGTDFIYYAITQNESCVSVVGGGDTISAIAHEEYLEKITHISTGGGAMLEFIEKGTLPGIEALN